MLQFDDHPLLHPAACLMRWPAPLGEIPASPDLRALAALDADVPVSRNEDVRGAVRRLLRHGGHKPSGRLKGLLCLFDAEGPCANSVKDSQRTKTHPGTRSTLSVVWGPNEHVPHVEATLAWYRACMEMFGAETVWATGM